MSEGFINQTRYWGISISKGFVKEPETNGVIERFHRTFKEQIVHGRHYHGLEDFRKAVAEFIKSYNEHWLLEKLDYHSPLEARELYSKEHPSEQILSALAEVGEGARLLCSGKDMIAKTENFRIILKRRKKFTQICVQRNGGDTRKGAILGNQKYSLATFSTAQPIFGNRMTISLPSM